MKQEIGALREKLDHIDSEFVELLHKRMAVVDEIKQLKRATAFPTFDRKRERDLLNRAEKKADELGLSKKFVRRVMHALLEASHDLQDQQQDPAAMGTNDRRRLLIVGGHGKMGKRFRTAFERRGHNVEILDKDDALDPHRIAEADVVMIAVPMPLAVSVTEEVAKSVRRDAVLCDINSLKEDVCTALQKSTGQAVGLHPMFGPTVTSLRRQKVVICHIKPGPMSCWLEQELERMGAELIYSDPKAHDQMMAVVQVLTHFGTMVMGRALSHASVTLKNTLMYMSPIYRLEVSMVGRLFSQQSELYREILMENPNGRFVRALFVEEATKLALQIDDGDREAFANSFDDTSAFFSAFSDEAMSLSDQIIDTLMSHP